MKKMPIATNAASGSEFADGQRVEDETALPDAPDIDCCERGDDERNESASRPSRSEDRRIERQRRCKYVDHRGPARGSGEPEHPAHLERGETSEGSAHVEIGTAGRVEAAAHFREGERNEQRRKPGRGDQPRAPGTDARGIERRLRKQRAAYDLIDTDGREIPPAKLAAQRDARRRCQGRCAHRAGCIMTPGPDMSTGNSEIVVKPRAVMPEDARTLPAPVLHRS